MRSRISIRGFVRQSVRPSVGPSLDPSVRRSRTSWISKKWAKSNKIASGTRKTIQRQVRGQFARERICCSNSVRLVFSKARQKKGNWRWRQSMWRFLFSIQSNTFLLKKKDPHGGELEFSWVVFVKKIYIKERLWKPLCRSVSGTMVQNHQKLRQTYWARLFARLLAPHTHSESVGLLVFLKPQWKIYTVKPRYSTPGFNPFSQLEHTNLGLKRSIFVVICLLAIIENLHIKQNFYQFLEIRYSGV